MKIVIGADGFGRELKDQLVLHLESLGHEVVDVGGAEGRDRAYYEVAHEAARMIGAGERDRAILCCGSGMGMAIVANKHAGVYAAVCEDERAAANARSINNANVLTLGAMNTAQMRARQIVDVFLGTDFKSGWDTEIREFLDRSMVDIHAIESSEFAGRDET